MSSNNRKGNGKKSTTTGSSAPPVTADLPIFVSQSNQTEQRVSSRQVLSESNPDLRALVATILQELHEPLTRIESKIDALRSVRTARTFYTTVEFAELVGKAEFTVREWCRYKRIHAEKQPCGRGDSKSWKISHEELLRYQNDGLLPNEFAYHHPR